MYLVVTGGNRLFGQVKIDGAKNAVLPGCAASLLTDETIIIHRVPRLRDVTTMLGVISELGKDVEYHDDTVIIRSGSSLQAEADRKYVEQMRASFLVLGPLLARLGHAVVPLPGGCTIGPRPVNYHLQGLAALGAQVIEASDKVTLTTKRLCGTQVKLPYPSVGATEQLLMAASLAEGTTVIENPSREPEVLDLVTLLQKMGAQIMDGEAGFTIVGVKKLGGAEHTVIPDRLEAGTYLLAGAITAGRVEVNEVEPRDLTALTEVLIQAGTEVNISAQTITVTGIARPRALHLETAPFPGFPTDLQPPLVALLSRADGTSTIQDTVFPHRFAYVKELNQMGAQIAVRDGTAHITGVDKLHGAALTAPDIRAGAALVLAALSARGTSTIYGLDQIDRGYTNLERKLTQLGAKIDRHN